MALILPVGDCLKITEIRKDAVRIIGGGIPNKLLLFWLVGPRSYVEFKCNLGPMAQQLEQDENILWLPC